MVAGMDTISPATPQLASGAGPAFAGRRFVLVVYPESLQRRWHAVLQPEPTAAADAPLEFSTPLDLLRHLAQLPPSPPEHAVPPRDNAGPVGLR